MAPRRAATSRSRTVAVAAPMPKPRPALTGPAPPPRQTAPFPNRRCRRTVAATAPGPGPAPARRRCRTVAAAGPGAALSPSRSSPEQSNRKEGRRRWVFGGRKLGPLVPPPVKRLRLSPRLSPRSVCFAIQDGGRTKGHGWPDCVRPPCRPLPGQGGRRTWNLETSPINDLDRTSQWVREGI
jgi:hypothetical protein